MSTMPSPAHDYMRSSPVLILGAGFSRALSLHSPLTDELGELAVQALPMEAKPSVPFRGGYFETWLSRLAENQPDLDAVQNQLNRANFMLLIEAINEILSERELDILRDEPPDWLFTFLSVAHANRATLITFNYDVLIEHGVMSHQLFDWNRLQRATWDDVVDHTPPLPPVPARFAGNGETATFRLLKLHGSTNNYWVPGDQTGATIHRWDLFGEWGSPEGPDPVRRRRELPGRTPFIVPPAAGKSTYYDNPVTRHLWMQAGKSLREAGELALIGYSLPPTDLATSGMLGDHLSNRDIPIRVVNPDPRPVVDHLRFLGFNSRAIDTIDSVDCVRLYVEQILESAARQAASNVSPSLGPEPLLVAWSEAAGAIVTDVRKSVSDGAVAELQVEDITTIGQASRSRTGPDRRPVQGLALKELLNEGANKLVALFPSGRRCTVVDHAEWITNIGFDSRWTVLVPAGKPEPL